MKFEPYVYNSEKEIIPITIDSMTSEDAEQTNYEPRWQTSWTSDYIREPRFEKYAAKVGDELIGLGAYEIQQNALVVHIAYIESQPQSNPVIVNENRKYFGIGRTLVAFGIKLSVDNGFNGDVILEAKTPELEKHYVNDFGAVKLPVFNALAPRYLIADEAAKNIFFSYLK